MTAAYGDTLSGIAALFGTTAADIARINAAARMNDLSYSRMIDGLKKAGVIIDRKMLSDIAINDAEGFTKLAETAKAALNK